MYLKANRRLSFALKVALPICAGTLLAIVIAAFSLIWSTQRIDQIAIDRQKSLATVVFEQLRGGIAHDQESTTVWDDAVNMVRTTRDATWLDGNLGSWMHTYFGHDNLYVIDPANQPIYAFAEDEVQPAARYSEVAGFVGPLAERLRRELRTGTASGIDDQHLSPGVAEFVLAGGRPAVVSLKPIISDSGEIVQAPGTEYIHVALRFLDGSLLTSLSQQYRFAGLGFSRQVPDVPHVASLALASGTGAPMGYLYWMPERPGLDFVTSIMPMLIGAVAEILLLVAVVITILYRRSTANERNQARIAFLAHHDTLTGLRNRHSFDSDLDAALAGPSGAAKALAVLYLDLDRFKKVNDTLGHAAGDHVICEAGRRMSALLAADARLYRIGGDEFMIVAPNPDKTQINALCEALVAAICEPIDIDGRAVYIGVSIGVAFGPEDGEDRATLTRKADIALYHAKASGRGRHSLFGHRMDALVADKAQLEQDLRSALRSGEQLKVYYQPKMNAVSHEMAGVEALVRWHHPERGILSPTLFIAIAEDAGMIPELGAFVLDNACRAAGRWPIGSVAVNVSSLQLKDPAFALLVASTLSKTGLAPGKLELEITESAWLDESEAGEQNIIALRQLGVKIALDDFGTGFSSLGRLHALEVDRIKIDQSFVSGLGHSAGDEAIIRAMIDMAHAHGLATTAEGVETEAQRDFLSDIGCDELQGFLYSQAVPEGEIDQLFDKGGVVRLRA